MDLFLLQLIAFTYLFGPAVVIPFAEQRMNVITIAFFVLTLQAITMIALFKFLQFIDYGAQCKRRFISNFCGFTEKELSEVRKNADVLFRKFHRRGGHHGYYLSLLFFSFAIGFGWAVVIAYSLKLKRAYSYTFILTGSALSFFFWYLVLLFSLNFVTAEVFTLVSISMALFLFSYGRLKEKSELARLSRVFKKAKQKTSSALKKKLRKKVSEK